MFWIATILIVVFVLVLPGIAGLEDPLGIGTPNINRIRREGGLEDFRRRDVERLTRLREEQRIHGPDEIRDAQIELLDRRVTNTDVETSVVELIEEDDAIARAAEAGVQEGAQAERDAQLSPDIAREIRFQKQCFLAFNMLDILSKIREIPGRNTITVPQYHTVLVGDAAPADITSLIVSRPDIHQLLNAKPFLLSYFMPQVRLYKVFGNPRDEDRTREIEFVFSDHVTESRVRDILTNRAGRGDGVGLLSFNWEFLGVNPAEVENNIKASLKLHFNNMRDFEEERIDPGTDLKYRFSDLIIAEPLYQVNASDPSFPAIQRAFNPNFFRLKVVAGWTLPRESEEARALFEESGVNFDDLVDLVKLNKKVLYLNLISHDLSFNDDGTLDLTVDYQAMIEGVFSSPRSDILNVEASESTTKVEARIEEVGENIRRLTALRGRSQEEVAAAITDIQGQIPEGDEYNVDEQLERARDHQDYLLGARNLLQQNDRDRAYSGILNRLVASDRIYNLTVTSQNLGFTDLNGFENEQLSLSQLDQDVRDRYVAAYEAQYDEEPEEEDPVDPDVLISVGGRSSLISDRPVQDARLMRRMIAQSRLTSRSDFVVETGFTINTTVEMEGAKDPCTFGGPLANLLTQRSSGLLNANNPNQQGQNLDNGIRTLFSDDDYRDAVNNIRSWIELGPVGRDRIPLKFMLFGDILDVVAGNAAEWLKESNVGIYLGPFAYNDPAEYLTGERPKPIYVPLAYIPISVELFSMWFFTEIIEKGRTHMTIRQFIRSVFNKLVINAFGGECVFDPSGKFFLTQENFSIAPEFYSIPTTKLRDVGIHDIGGGGLPGGVGNYERMERAIRQNAENNIRLLDYEPSATFDDYTQVVLYQARSDDEGAGRIFGTDIATDGYLQVAESDIERGVYHLNLGSDRGLVKSISFDRIDQDYMLEARIEAAGELGSFGQLRHRYNATVTLYGNMFFYPGQYIYINPSMVGVRDEQGAHSAIPSVSALTTKLGIGGYFLITKVENIIESGLFETILKCSWVYSGFRIETERGESVSGTIDFFYQPSIIERAVGTIRSTIEDPPTVVSVPRDELGLSEQDYQDIEIFVAPFREIAAAFNNGSE